MGFKATRMHVSMCKVGDAQNLPPLKHIKFQLPCFKGGGGSPMSIVPPIHAPLPPNCHPTLSKPLCPMASHFNVFPTSPSIILTPPNDYGGN
jgi:hypothetical protein